jgi:hypothetical protein
MYNYAGMFSSSEHIKNKTSLFIDFQIINLIRTPSDLYILPNN